MEKTPRGTSVGVEDPYEFAGLCDHLTDDGRCRFAVERYGHDPEFARARADEGYVCPAADPDDECEWADCPHFRSRTQDRECARCGLTEKRNELTDDRPLLEEHHLSYDRSLRPTDGADSDPEDGVAGETRTEPSHEITIYLCRWCHAKVHNSWARIADDVSPDPEAIAELESRRGRELEEAGFDSAASRYDRE